MPGPLHDGQLVMDGGDEGNGHDGEVEGREKEKEKEEVGWPLMATGEMKNVAFL